MTRQGEEQADAGRRFRIPEHVIYQSFDSETIVLNLKTGRYHGLNTTAARMLELLGQHQSVDDVAAVVADEFGQPVATVASDVRELCDELTARDLLEVDDGSG